MATVNNNWPTPVATDLVKDGWEAIKDLGDAIDTTLGVYTPPATGLTLINTTSFSGVSSISVNDVFSATYDTYLINFIATVSGTLDFRFRYRVGGVDNSTASSYQACTFINYDSGGPLSAAEVQTQNYAQALGGIQGRVLGSLIIYDPFAAVTTFADTNLLRNNNTLAARSNISHNQNTSYDGITFLTSANTITGSVKVYGYNK
jgi:hypothetical protein